MQTTQRVIERIREAFRETERPATLFCRGATRAANRLNQSHLLSASPIGHNWSL